MQICTSLSPCQREGKSERDKEDYFWSRRNSRRSRRKICRISSGKRFRRATGKQNTIIHRRPNVDDLRRTSTRPIKELSRTHAAGNKYLLWFLNLRVESRTYYAGKGFTSLKLHQEWHFGDLITSPEDTSKWNKQNFPENPEGSYLKGTQKMAYWKK